MNAPTTSSERTGETPLPSTAATTLRFILLAVTATAAVAAIANWLLPYAFGFQNADTVAAVNECHRAVYRDLVAISRDNDTWDVFRSTGPLHERFAEREDCPDPHASWAWPLIGAVAFWAVVLGLLLWLPAWRVRRRRYEFLGRVANREVPQDASPLVRALAELQRRAGVGTAVTYLRDNLDPRCTALAFGRAGHRCVVLSNGIETLLRRDRPSFDAIVLHEIAHVRNRDIDIGFLTIIAWRVAMPLVTAAGLVVLLGGITRSSDTPLAVRVAESALSVELLGLALTVLLLRNSVLRTRELLADARVSHWAAREQTAEMLTRYFPASPRRPKPLRTHPAVAQRIAALDDGSEAASATIWVWFSVGLVTKILSWAIAVSLGGDGAASRLAFGVAAAFVLTAFALEIVQDPRSPRRFRKSRPIAIGLGLGLAAGFLAFEPTVILIASWTNDAFTLQYLLWIPILCGASWLAFRWLGVVAEAWTPVLRTRTTAWSRGLSRAALALTIVPLWVGLLFLVTQQTQSIIGPLLDVSGPLSAFAPIIELPLRFEMYPYYFAGPLLLTVVLLPLLADVVIRRGLSSQTTVRPTSGLLRGLLTGLGYGLAGIPLAFFAVAYLNPSDERSLWPFFIDGMAAVLAAIVCASHLGYWCARLPHPVSVAVSGAMTAALSHAAYWSIMLGGQGFEFWRSLDTAWYPVPASAVLGAAAAWTAGTLRRRRPERAPRAARPPQTRRPWGHRRIGLVYGAAAGVAGSCGMYVLPFAPFLIWPIVQVICAVQVVRRPGLHPVRSATTASILAGVVGIAGTLPLIALASVVGGLPVGSAVGNWVLVGLCPTAVGTGVAAAVAGIVHSSRKRREPDPPLGPRDWLPPLSDRL